MRSRGPSRDTTVPSSSTMPVNIRASPPGRGRCAGRRRARATDRMRPRHTSAMVGAPGPANRPRASSPPKRAGREVEHVAVDEAGLVERVGHGGAALHQHLEVALGAELVEQRHRGRRRAPGTGGPWPRRARGRAPPAADRPAGPAASRTVRVGSSARTVPAPTTTASLSARRAWASARASGPVIHWLRAVRGGRAAVERGRQLQHDEGAPGAAVVEVRARGGRPPRPRSTPTSTLMPGGLAGARSPGPPPAGPGPRWRPRPDRRRPRSARRRTEGVRPWCEQGSRVTHAVAPREVVVAGGRDGAWPRRAVRPPAGWRPRTRCRRPPRSRSPTHGFGGVDARTDAASSRARAMRSVSVAAVMSSPGPAGPRAGTTTATDRGRSRSVLAPIRTLTVGSGISPDRPPHWR